MWGKIRKLILVIGFMSALLMLLILVETGKFESPTGLFLMLVNIFYIFWVTAGNIGNREEN